MLDWMKKARAMPRERMEIISHDGKKLVGYYYEYSKNAPIEILFHGYQGDGERDLSGGIDRCFRIGRSAIIVDQRAHGESEGSVCTFGIKERLDCLAWVDHLIKRFGDDVKIILTGVSMGAATVMMAAGKELPPQVMGVLADCGYNSPKEIICTIIKQMKIPPQLGYPFVKLGARIFGHFDLEEAAPEEALKHAKVPVIFFHGEADDFVPCYMSKKCYEACASRKALVTIPGAGHGLSFPVDSETYISSLREFFGPEASA
jgi:fermentation-respiration switch protein FrsA (DUF1100 family)